MDRAHLRLPVGAAVLAVLAACGGSTPRASDARQVEGDSSEEIVRREAPATTAAAARDVRELGYDSESCHEAGSSALWDALAPHAPAFFVDAEGDWLSRDCAFFVPEPDAVPRVRGAMFVDLDADGHEEAIAEVRYARARADGPREQTVEGRAVVVVRTQVGVDLPQVAVLVSDERMPEEADWVLEGFDGVRVENGRLVLVGTAGCYDCGCDSVEVDYECRTGECTYAGHRVTDPVEDCESP